MLVAKPNAVKKNYDENSGKHVACQLCLKILANKKNLNEHMLRRNSEHKQWFAYIIVPKISNAQIF
jgi:hypothetical protein